MKRNFFITIFLLSAVFLPSLSHAQMNFGGSLDLAGELTVNINPTFPGPNQNVYVNLEMYTEDLNSASISWFLNGKLISKGKGLKSVSFKTGNTGGDNRLTIDIAFLNGKSITKEMNIIPAKVDITWQADSYTPPFYKGKANLSPQGVVRLYASPTFSNSFSSMNNPSSLIYTWKINGEVKQNMSGYGKNIAIMNNSVLGQRQEIEVTVSDPKSNMSAADSIVLNPQDPFIIFYENNPLYGMIFEKSMGASFSLTNQEINVVAFPFNTSKEDVNNLVYTWKINGQSAGIANRSALFRKPEGTSGESRVSLDIKNPRKFLQYTDADLLVKFEDN